MSSEHGGKAANRIDAIVASATDAIVTADSGGLVVSWNPAAERMFRTRRRRHDRPVAHTSALIKDEVYCRPLGDVDLKGIHGVRTYEVVGDFNDHPETHRIRAEVGDFNLSRPYESRPRLCRARQGGVAVGPGRTRGRP